MDFPLDPALTLIGSQPIALLLHHPSRGTTNLRFLVSKSQKLTLSHKFATAVCKKGQTLYLCSLAEDEEMKVHDMHIPWRFNATAETFVPSNYRIRPTMMVEAPEGGMAIFQGPTVPKGGPFCDWGNEATRCQVNGLSLSGHPIYTLPVGNGYDVEADLPENVKELQQSNTNFLWATAYRKALAKHSTAMFMRQDIGENWKPRTGYLVILSRWNTGRIVTAELRSELESIPIIQSHFDLLSRDELKVTIFKVDGAKRTVCEMWSLLKPNLSAWRVVEDYMLAHKRLVVVSNRSSEILYDARMHPQSTIELPSTIIDSLSTGAARIRLLAIDEHTSSILSDVPFSGYELLQQKYIRGNAIRIHNFTRVWEIAVISNLTGEAMWNCESPKYLNQMQLPAEYCYLATRGICRFRVIICTTYGDVLESTPFMNWPEFAERLPKTMKPVVIGHGDVKRKALVRASASGRFRNRLNGVSEAIIWSKPVYDWADFSIPTEIIGCVESGTASISLKLFEPSTGEVIIEKLVLGLGIVQAFSIAASSRYLAAQNIAYQTNRRLCLAYINDGFVECMRMRRKPTESLEKHISETLTETRKIALRAAGQELNIGAYKDEFLRIGINACHVPRASQSGQAKAAKNKGAQPRRSSTNRRASTKVKAGNTGVAVAKLPNEGLSDIEEVVRVEKRKIREVVEVEQLQQYQQEIQARPQMPQMHLHSTQKSSTIILDREIRSMRVISSDYEGRAENALRDVTRKRKTMSPAKQLSNIMPDIDDIPPKPTDSTWQQKTEADIEAAKLLVVETNKVTPFEQPLPEPSKALTTPKPRRRTVSAPRAPRKSTTPRLSGPLQPISGNARATRSQSSQIVDLESGSGPSGTEFEVLTAIGVQPRRLSFHDIRRSSTALQFTSTEDAKLVARRNDVKNAPRRQSTPTGEPASKKQKLGYEEDFTNSKLEPAPVLTERKPNGGAFPTVVPQWAAALKVSAEGIKATDTTESSLPSDQLFREAMDLNEVHSTPNRNCTATSETAPNELIRLNPSPIRPEASPTRTEFSPLTENFSPSPRSEELAAPPASNDRPLIDLSSGSAELPARSPVAPGLLQAFQRLVGVSKTIKGNNGLSDGDT